PICCSSSPPWPRSPSSTSSSCRSGRPAHEGPPAGSTPAEARRLLPRRAAGRALAGRRLPHLWPAGVLDAHRPLPPLLALRHLLQAAHRRRLSAEYLPFVDFQPSLSAWRYIFVDLGNDTLRPYFNSIVVATISTLLAVLTGSMAAYG